MIILDGADDKIECQCGTGGDIEASVSWAENNAGVITPGGLPRASITGTGATDLITAPGGGKQRAVKEISLFNNDAASNLVEVRRKDAANTVRLQKVNLLPGESLVLDEVGVWTHYDANGGQYPALGNIASQAEMEAGSSTSVVVTPGRQHFHPGHPKCWGKTTVSGGTPTLQNSYNITSITDTATGRLTWTIATDFSSANWAFLGSVERANTTTTVANARDDCLRNATQAAGALEHECWDKAATNNALADPASWFMCGLGDQ